MVFLIALPFLEGWGMDGSRCRVTSSPMKTRWTRFWIYFFMSASKNVAARITVFCHEKGIEKCSLHKYGTNIECNDWNNATIQNKNSLRTGYTSCASLFVWKENPKSSGTNLKWAILLTVPLAFFGACLDLLPQIIPAHDFKRFHYAYYVSKLASAW